jgi:hypothetical protein
MTQLNAIRLEADVREHAAGLLERLPDAAPDAPDGYTYRLYKQVWADEFGDAPAGEYGYYEGETYHPVRVTRLTKPEFEAHKAALDALSANFALALETGDDLMMDALLESGFQHELALLL